MSSVPLATARCARARVARRCALDRRRRALVARSSPSRRRAAARRPRPRRGVGRIARRAGGQCRAGRSRLPTPRAPTRRADAARPPKVERVQITDPYIELRTGPGRGYPDLLRRARAASGSRSSCATPTGIKRPHRRRQGRLGHARSSSRRRSPRAARSKSFRDILLDDYLSAPRRSSARPRATSSREPMLKFWTQLPHVRDAEHRGHARPGAGRVLGHRLLARQPDGRAVVRPALLAVRRRSASASSRTSRTRAWSARAPPTRKLANASVGVRYHLTDRFVLRADYALYTAFVSDQRTHRIPRLRPPGSPSSSDAPTMTARRQHHEHHHRLARPAPRARWPPLRCAAPRCARRPRRRRRTTDQVVVPQVDRRDVQQAEVSRRTTSRSACSAAPTRRRTSAPAASAACASATTSPRTSSSRRATRDQGQRQGVPPDPAGRHLPEPSRRSCSYYDLSVGYNVLPGEIFIGSKLRARPRSCTSSAASAAPSSTSSACRPATSASAAALFLADWVALQRRRARPHLLARPARQAPEHAEPRADRAASRSSSDLDDPPA